MTTGLRAVLGAARLTLAGLCLGLLAQPAGAAPAPRTPHGEAVAALADMRAAVDEITAASHLESTDPGPFKNAAQRAIADLGGGTNKEAGAIGHLDWLLHLAQTYRWTPAVHGTWANVTIAVGQLQQAMTEHGFEGYITDISVALDNLEVALGRPDADPGEVLGGLEGALATTELGVPAGAATQPGCRAPTHAPAYGVADGYLLYVALPAGHGVSSLHGVFGVRGISVEHGLVVAQTVAAAAKARICAQSRHAALQTPVAKPALLATSSDPPSAGAVKPDAPPQLYTEAQAKAGKVLFENICAACHGPHMEGGSAPPNAGRDFLEKAHALGWSVNDMRMLVVSAMPLNNPSSLTPKQYADLLAFLLASDCYPSGTKPFPTDETAQLKSTPLGPVASAHPDNPKLGTCHVD